MTGVARTRSAPWLPGLAVLILTACTAAPDSPEAQVRALLSRAESAAEKRDVGVFKGLISEGYTDEQGQDRQALVGLLTYYFLRHQTIHLFTRIQFIDVADAKNITFADADSAEPESARASILVAMAGTPILVVDDLERLRADLYHFDFDLVREDDDEWRVSRAAWSRATRSHFLP